MKKMIFSIIMICVLFFSLIITSCDNGATGNNNGGNGGSTGRLTVENFSGTATVTVSENASITTMTEYTMASVTKVMYTTVISKSPFHLVFKTAQNYGSPFNMTGKFMVGLVTPAQDVFFITDVNFINGSATIDFTTMRRFDELPLGF